MASPTFFAEGNTPRVNDTLWRIEQKILGALIDNGGGGGGGAGSGGITPAAGAPPTDGSISTLFYKNTSTGVIYINTGTEAVPVWDAI